MDLSICAPGVCIELILNFVHCNILEGFMEQFPGAQFWGKCTL